MMCTKWLMHNLRRVEAEPLQSLLHPAPEDKHTSATRKEVTQLHETRLHPVAEQ